MCLPCSSPWQRSCGLLFLNVGVLTLLFGCGSSQKPPIPTPPPQASSQPSPVPGMQPTSPTPPKVPQASSPSPATPPPAPSEDSDDVKRLHAIGATQLPRFPGTFFTNEKITQIVFSNQPQSDEDFSIIEKFPNVKILQIESGKISDAGMPSVAKLKSLKELWIKGSPITDAGIEHLRGLTEMEKLILNGIPISDEGVKNFQDMTKLTWLSLSGCGGITDKSIDELQKLKSLKTLFVDMTKITPDGATKLQAALPECKVITR